MPLIRLFIVSFVGGRVGDSCAAVVACFLMLMKVMDLLVKINRGKQVSPAQLKQTIFDHAKAFLDIHGHDYWVPKNHLALHLPDMLRRAKTLVSLFTHERKHKAIKRFANNLTTSTLSYEKSMLEDLWSTQLETLAEPSAFPSGEIVFTGQKAAPRALREGLGLRAEDISVSQMATIDGLRVYAKDVCSFISSGEERIGQVYCHVVVYGVKMTCISEWTLLQPSIFDMTETLIFVPTSYIKDLHPYSVKESRALVCAQ